MRPRGSPGGDGEEPFLLEGGRGDLIMLYNDSGKAPSVVRNLRGELVFEDGRAPPACITRTALGRVPQPPDPRPERRARAKLDLPLRPCGPNDLAKQDLIFAERERLLREPVDRVITLVEAVNGNLFARLAVVDAAALAAVRQRTPRRPTRSKRWCAAVRVTASASSWCRIRQACCAGSRPTRPRRTRPSSPACRIGSATSCRVVRSSRRRPRTEPSSRSSGPSAVRSMPARPILRRSPRR